MKSNTIIAIIIAVMLIGGAFVLNGKSEISDSALPANNVTIVDGKQIIEIKAKGGYSPRKSIAKSGIPTILRFKTEATFDCSSAIRIASLNISKNLPQSGMTDIDIGTNESGIFRGTCGMGMYPFEIEFQG